MTRANTPSGLLPSFSRWLLRRRGWHINTELPSANKYVLIVYPHTSNWDFALAMLTKSAIGYRVHWVAKHSLFWWPLGVMMRAMGGIAVDRRKTNGLIDQLAEQFHSHDKMIIGITPEGTRSYRPYWKSGFYHLAQQAQVPIALGYIDHDKKEIGIGATFEVSGDKHADIAKIRDFYTDKPGRYPAKAGPVMFRDDT